MVRKRTKEPKTVTPCSASQDTIRRVLLKTIATRLQDRMNELNMNREEVYFNTGISNRSIGIILKGEKTYSLELVVRLMHKLNCDLLN